MVFYFSHLQNSQRYIAFPPLFFQKKKGGDGDKRVLVEEVREKHMLEDRVIMKGMIPHSAVRDVRTHMYIHVQSIRRLPL